MRYRLGIDLGTNSLGWAILELNDDGSPSPKRVVRLGSRIYSDGRNPKDGQSLAVMRRGPRAQRRRRDRYLKRRDRLMDALVEFGLMPNDPAERYKLVPIDPYRLRAKGLHEPLTPHEFGRAIFHLNQRRGFKSNRKTDKAADKETGKVKPAIAALEARISDAGTRTVGEYLARLRYPDGLSAKAANASVRARLRNAGKKDAAYDLYVSRELVEREYDELWKAQQRLSPALYLDEARDKIKGILFFQRALRPVDPGPCAIDPPTDRNDRDGRRAPLALPSTQRLRIYQELNNLRIALPGQQERPLSLAERDLLASRLIRGENLAFRTNARGKTDIRKLLTLPSPARINLEDADRRPEIKGDSTTAALANKKRFGDDWHRLKLFQQDTIVEALLEIEVEHQLVDWLTRDLRLDDDRALEVARVTLPDEYGRYGRRATGRLLPHLIEQVIPISEAAALAGYGAHSQRHDGVLRTDLPYYGEVLTQYVAGGTLDQRERNDEKRYGKLANPTVHIGLNQLRKVVNALIKKFGKPEQIVVELARDLKLSRDQKERLKKEQAENLRRNEQYRSELAAWPGPKPLDSAENRQRWKLWHAMRGESGLSVTCPYTGDPIGAAMLFSADVEIDHILPFSRTLDDGIGNKVLCVRRANRDKAGKTPYEAFGHSPSGYEWNDILARAERMFSKDKNKLRRFLPDGIAWYLREEKDFLARHLVDTAYLSRVARQYLECLYPPDAARIWASRGTLTGLIRGKWGLNKILSEKDTKNRTDHRHHAVDAAVIAAMDRSLLKAVSDASTRAESTGLNKLLDGMPTPYVEFRDEIANAAQRVIVSHKPDHGPEAALHDEQPYGIKSGPDAKGIYEVQIRKAVDTLSVDAISNVADPRLRELLGQATRDKTGAALAKSLSEFSASTGVHRVRILRRESIRPIKDITKRAYKGVKTNSNHCYEIWADETGRWKGDLVSTFDANSHAYRAFRQNIPAFRKTTFSGRALIMRLIKDDLVRMSVDGSEKVMRVVEVLKQGINFAEHFEANTNARNKDTDGGFRYEFSAIGPLRDRRARRVFVDPIGTLKDPGYRECLSDASST